MARQEKRPHFARQGFQKKGRVVKPWPRFNKILQASHNRISVPDFLRITIGTLRRDPGVRRDPGMRKDFPETLFVRVVADGAFVSGAGNGLALGVTREVMVYFF